MHILDTLRRALWLWPEREAVVDGPRRLTYRQLGDRVATLAAALARLGLGPGDRAGVLAPNVGEYLEVYYAAAAASVVLCPVNYRLTAGEVAEVLRKSGAKVLLAHRDFEDVVMAAAEGCPNLTTLVWLGEESYEDLARGAGAELGSALDGAGGQEELAHLYFTSGTTGSPKGVMLTHENVTTHALAAIAELGLSDADIWLHAAPLFHLADAWATFAVTWVGGRHVCLPYFEPGEALALIEREGVTLSNLVPTMLTMMVSDPSASEHDYGSLRLILSGGAPIAPETVRRVVTVLGCEYVQTYGMTETSPYLTLSLPKAHQLELPAEELLRIKSRTGRPMIGVDLKVLREDGSEVARDDAEVGEIVVRGPTVTPGYFDDEAATAEAFRDGWLATGDLAVIDAEGSVDIVDRKKDTIITGGENVHSVEVEHVVYDHPDVQECAVVGVPDELWGESVKAVVVPRAGKSPTAESIIDFVRERLARYKAPRSVDFVEALPKTGSGKISKRTLRLRYAKGSA